MPFRIKYAAALAVAVFSLAGPLRADDTSRTVLKPFKVTIRVFDPVQGMASGQDYVLPVDSPDAEHAVASTMANAASFTKKTDGGKAVAVAFTCVKVEPR